MPNTLVLDNPHATPEQLREFALNFSDARFLPAIKYPAFKYVYTCQSNGRPYPYALTHVVISRMRIGGLKQMHMHFSSKNHAVKFKNACRDLDLDLYFRFLEAHQMEARYSIVLPSNILNSSGFAKLRSILIEHFHLDAQSVDKVLFIAGQLEQTYHSRIQITNQFYERLRVQRSPANEEERKCAHDQVRGINGLARALLKEAQVFDNEEHLGQSSITYSLGQLFSSFNLHRQAGQAFAQITHVNSLDFPLAQKQLTRNHKHLTFRQ